MLRRHLRAVTIIAISAAGLAAAAYMREVVKPFSVYHDGDDLIFTPEMSGKHRLASVGPWNLGERVAEDKPVDKRLNLYFVSPGMQYRARRKIRVRPQPGREQIHRGRQAARVGHFLVLHP